MKDNEIRSKLFSIAEKSLGRSFVDIDANADLFEVMGLDSLSIVELITEIEEEFNFEFEEIELLQLSTPRELIELIKKYQT